MASRWKPRDEAFDLPNARVLHTCFPSSFGLSATRAAVSSKSTCAKEPKASTVTMSMSFFSAHKNAGVVYAESSGRLLQRLAAPSTNARAWGRRPIIIHAGFGTMRQDPTGQFIRQFVPELAAVPDDHLAEPHKMTLSEQSRAGCLIGTSYPSPIVEHSVAYKQARQRMYAVRRKDEAKLEAKRVVKKHGSRKRTTKGTTPVKTRERKPGIS